MAVRFPDDENEVRSKSFYDDLNEYDFQDCEYSLLIVGPSGAGKSTFCNFLIREKRFKEASGMLAGTAEAAYCRIPNCQDNVLVVDCPGFCDPKRPHEEILNEISKAAIMCRGGVDAIGIVINPMERFGESEKVSYDQIEHFGGKFWEHSFILFNHENKVKKKMGVNEAREYIELIRLDQKCPPQFTKLLNKVEDRYLCVESLKRFDDQEYWGKIRDSILAMILHIRDVNDERYVNGFMKEGRITYDELIEIRSEMTAAIESMRDVVNLQGERINFLETLRISMNAHYVDRIGQLTKDYEDRIKKYESQIEEKKPKCFIS